MKNHDRFFGMVTLKDGSGKKKKKQWIRSPVSLCRASERTGPELYWLCWLRPSCGLEKGKGSHQ